jgi:ABC-type transport system substrate-binding protein
MESLRPQSKGGSVFPALRLLRVLPLAALLGLAGCGNNPYPASERRQGMICSSIGDDPKTLDPAVVYNVTDNEINSGIYATFLQYNYLKRDPFRLEPGLGAEMPKREPFMVQVSRPGGTKSVKGERWTFRIKQGLRFQDDPCFPGGRGREILASDFIHAFKRMADPEVHCPIFPFLGDKVLGFHAFQERVSALESKGKRADYGLPVEGLQTDPKDPYLFRIVLNQPYPQLRYLMAMAFTTPLAPEATERYGKELGRHPVGNGPYVLAEWLPKQRIVLRRNPNYRRDDLYPAEGMPGDRERGLLADAGQRLPLNDGIVFTVVREGITAWNLFQQGYLDAYGVDQTNYSQVVSRVGSITPQMAAKGITLSSSTPPQVNYFAFNMKDPVVGGFGEKQRKLRQALSLCYDEAAELNLFNAGLGKEAQWLVPPGVFGYDPAYRNPYRQTSLERARQLLAEAGYPKGVSEKTGERLEITYENAATTPADRNFVGFVQKQFAQIGVRIASRSWRDQVWQDRLNQGQFQFTAYGWVADYPDPENFVFLLYGPNGREVNLTGYDRPEYNRLYEQMRSLDDGPEREAIIRRMREMAVEDCPYILKSHNEDLKLNYPWVRNDKTHPIAMDVYKYRRIDPELRAQLRRRWNRPNVWPLAALAALLVGGSIPAMAAVRRRSRLTARRRARQW